MKKRDYHKLALANGFPVVPRGKCIWKEETSLYGFNGQGVLCLRCGTNLYQDETRIPVSQTEEAIISVLYCPSCHKSYVRDSDKIAMILHDNDFAKAFTLDSKQLWNATQRERQKKKRRQLLEDNSRLHLLLKPIESAVVLLHIRYSNQEEKDFIIVNDLQESAPKDGVYHYSSDIARELLSAAFRESRKRKGVLNSRSFYVVRYFFKDAPHKTIPDSIAPVTLSIEAGGGLYSSLVNKRREIVDMLLYSPFTRRYEIIKATFNKDEGYSFVDIRLYRSFVEKYGNPQVDIFFERTCCAWNDWSQLNTESVLKGYGYSVSKADNLSDKERREMLAEVIDLSILSVEKIISHLDFAVRTHPLPKDEIPRFKWNEDKKFVENYCVNPLRFLIAK